MKTVLILANHFITIYAFRRELVERLLNSDYNVIIALPYSEDAEFFSNIGCKIIDTPLERRKTNPFNDLKLLIQYTKIIRKEKPDIVLTYTIKPNIYGGLAARVCRVKTLHTVTGLGSVYIKDMWQKKIAAFLNKLAFKNSKAISFLNIDNEKFYRDIGIISKDQKTFIVPGSGVNMERFEYQELELKDDITFIFIGRILKDKGIEEFLSAAERIRAKYLNTHFEVVGFVDEERYIQILSNYEKKGVINYLGKRNDIPEIMSSATCIVLPSYGEGRGTVLQEGAAVGRPLITCDTYGCRENVEENKNGYLCKVADSKSLEKCMEKFIKLSNDEKLLMGKYSREKAVKEFDRQIVTDAYLKEIKLILEGKQNEFIPKNQK